MTRYIPILSQFDPDQGVTHYQHQRCSAENLLLLR